MAEAHAGEGRGERGAGSARGASRVTPPVSAGPIMAASGCLLGPGPRPEPPVWEGTLPRLKHPLSPLLSYAGRPHPAPTPTLLDTDTLVGEGAGLSRDGSVPWPESCLGPRLWALTPGQQRKLVGGGLTSLALCAPQSVV